MPAVVRLTRGTDCASHAMHTVTYADSPRLRHSLRHRRSRCRSIALLTVHPSRRHDLREPDRVRRRAGRADRRNTAICSATSAPGSWRRRADSADEFHARSRIRGCPIQSISAPAKCRSSELPPETLRFLMASRFCEVDLLSPIAVELFGDAPRGWARVQAICDWVHSKVTFSYPHARPTRTALDVFTERVGVCRDFQHLAITFCRAMNIPARYATGYLGDIGVPPSGADGLQRLVRGLSRRSLVDLRRPPQPAAHRPRAARAPASTPPTSRSPPRSAASKLTHFEVVTDEIV